MSFYSLAEREKALIFIAFVKKRHAVICYYITTISSVAIFGLFNIMNKVINNKLIGFRCRTKNTKGPEKSLILLSGNPLPLQSGLFILVILDIIHQDNILLVDVKLLAAALLFSRDD